MIGILNLDAPYEHLCAGRSCGTGYSSRKHQKVHKIILADHKVRLLEIVETGQVSTVCIQTTLHMSSASSANIIFLEGDGKGNLDVIVSSFYLANALEMNWYIVSFWFTQLNENVK